MKEYKKLRCRAGVCVCVLFNEPRLYLGQTLNAAFYELL